LPDTEVIPVKSPFGNSGTSEPAAGPVVPLFPQPPVFGGHNSRKRGIRTGIIEKSPAGMGEVIFGEVTSVERRRRCGSDEGGSCPGGSDHFDIRRRGFRPEIFISIVCLSIPSSQYLSLHRPGQRSLFRISFLSYEKTITIFF
jgi:hypothetical protein